MYSSCLKEFSIDCLVHVEFTLSRPQSLAFEMQHLKVHVTSLACPSYEMLLFILFQPQPYPQLSCPRENQIKIVDDKTTILIAVQGSGSRRGSRTFHLLTPLGPAPYSSMNFPVLFAGPAVTKLDADRLLGSFFCKQKQLSYKNKACDLWWSPNKRWFCIPVKGCAAVSSCWCFRVFLLNVGIPVGALVSKGKLCFSAGLERPSTGVERDAECCSKLFLLWCL